MEPNIATPISTEAAVASAVVRSRKRRNGITGSAATLASTYRAAAITAMPAATSSAVVGRDPVELLAGQGHPDQQDADAGDDQGGAEVVDLHRPLDHRQVQRALQHPNASAAIGRPTKKQPRQPSGAVDDQPTDQRAADRGQREHRTDVAGVATPLTRADHGRDHDLDQRGEAADAEALDGPGADQHPMLGANAATSEPAEKMTSAVCTSSLLAEQVGELAPDRRGRRHREQGGHDHPGVPGLAALEVGDDPPAARW